MSKLKKVASSVIQKFPPLYRGINRFRGFRLHEPSVKAKCAVLGSTYGGWGIPVGFLRSDSVVYSVGVGEDISFDLELIGAFGCDIHSLDPTPIAVQFIQNSSPRKHFYFYPIGIAAIDGDAKFFSPQIKGYHSFSKTIDEDDGAVEEISCRVLTLKSIMAKLGHDHVDLLKLDIEGFEYEVIEEMIDSRTLPQILLVEFHHLTYGITIEKTKEAVAKLLGDGYQLFWVSDLGKEYGFLLNR